MLVPSKTSKKEQKSFQNPPKSIQNLPELLQTSDWNPKRVPNASRNPCSIKFFQFFHFLRGPGLPKSSQDRQNLRKKTLKNQCWKKMCFENNVYWIINIFASENGTKINAFSHFFRKRRFCENHCFSNGKLLFSRFGTFKNPSKIDAKTRSNKTWPNTTPKIDFQVLLASQKPPKIYQKSKKLLQKAT